MSSILVDDRAVYLMLKDEDLCRKSVFNFIGIL